MSQQYSFTFDLTEEGYHFLKPYQRVALQILWTSTEGLSAKEVWNLINIEMSQSHSRASVIDFLRALVECKIIEYRMEPGNGINKGYYWYKHGKNQLTNFLEKIINNILNNLHN